MQDTKLDTSTRGFSGSERIAPLGKLRIVVLAGGPSSEREVSESSGAAVAAALATAGHTVVLRDIGPDDLSALEERADFFFIALHGEFGEDGQVQAELERRNLRYLGSDSVSSAIAMDKVQTKRVFEREGIPVAPDIVVTAETLPGWETDWPVPVVVKPVDAGSSVDTSLVRSREELLAATSKIVASSGRALVERYIRGPELTVAILGDSALPVCEIRPAREFYDYHAKYVDDDTKYLFDLDLPAELIARVQRMSEQAHRALGCFALSRVDWMIDAKTLEPFALEINTIPGFTSHSLVPKAAARKGIDFAQLCEELIRLSMARGT